MNPPRTAPAPTPGVSRGPALLALLALLVTLGLGSWWTSESLVLSQTVSESRTVADMAENVGRWASQYGGVHVRTVGANAKIPGTFLTRSVYAANDGDSAVLQGSAGGQAKDERAAMERLEAYHWKNPALIQREVADVISASGSKARYRMTARTVLNPNNAPNAFEVEALDALQGGDGTRTEYWTTRSGQLLYARAVVAQKSCLRCHASQETAPEFIKANQQFNGGGGFGYLEGKPIGVISVAVPVPPTWPTLRASLAPQVWVSLAVALVAALALAWMLVRRPSRG